MDRLFLDANVLFSAAWRADSGLARLWDLPGVTLLTSSYAVEEARRNLPPGERRDRLQSLLKEMEVGEAMMIPPDLRGDIELPEKDWPVLGGAAAAGATHLVTGDQQHFGELYGPRVLGVVVMRPRDYLGS